MLAINKYDVSSAYSKFVSFKQHKRILCTLTVAVYDISAAVNHIGIAGGFLNSFCLS